MSKTILVRCDFCLEQEATDPDFGATTCTPNNPIFFKGKTDALICSDCLELAFNVYQKCCENYFKGESDE